MLSLVQAGKEHDSSVWKFQGVVMRKPSIRSDLPKPSHPLFERPRKDPQDGLISDVGGKCDLGSGPQAHRNICLAGGDKRGRNGIEPSGDEMVVAPRGSGRN